MAEAGAIAVGLTAIATFIGAFRVSGLIGRARAAMATASETVAVIGEKAMDDDEKERRVQRAALLLFGHAGLIAAIGAAVLATPAVVMWVGDAAGVAPFASVLAFLLDWRTIVGATALILVPIWLVRRH